MSGRGCCALGVAVAALSLAAPAQASTVFGGDDIDYSAAAGEVNNLTISRSGANYIITDPGATITPGGGCAAVNANQATCAAALVTEIQADLDDLGDTGTLDASVTGVLDSVSLRGEAGDDTLNAGPNVDTDLNGNDQNDTLNGSDSRDQLSGGDGNDTISGGGGGDSLSADLGNDVADGGPGTDFFSGSGGPDGADTLIGGPDEDDLDLRSRRAPLTIDANDVADDGEGCPGPGCEGDDVRADIERIDMGEGNDIVIGGAVRNQFFGGPGDDLLDGGGEADLVRGETGADTVRGGAGDDELDGGEDSDAVDGGGGADLLRDRFEDEAPDTYSGAGGTDLLSFAEANLALRVDLDGKPDDGESCPGPSCEGDNVMANVEDLEGGVAGDTLKGSRKANELIGGTGSDRLVGSGGADGLHGEQGDDNINGGKGRDLLEGASGAERIKSRDGGPDEVSCGSSRDIVKADGADRIAADCDRVKRKR